jgi:hypothetical protein
MVFPSGRKTSHRASFPKITSPDAIAQNKNDGLEAGGESILLQAVEGGGIGCQQEAGGLAGLHGHGPFVRCDPPPGWLATTPAG